MRKVPGWNEYFMGMAQAASLRSKDPDTQVGCYIVDQNNEEISCGYNGMPSGMIESAHLWERPTKYKYVCHAEVNAICHSKKSLKDAKLYCTMFPCAECAKLIAAAGISEVYYRDMKYDNEITRDIFDRCSIKLERIGEDEKN